MKNIYPPVLEAGPCQLYSGVFIPKFLHGLRRTHLYPVFGVGVCLPFPAELFHNLARRLGCAYTKRRRPRLSQCSDVTVTITSPHFRPHMDKHILSYDLIMLLL